jgi:conjugal transfer/entry exclusion protein
MFKPTSKAVVAIVSALLCTFGAQAGGGGFAGATEVTQLLNNGELLKVASDGAVTAAKTVQQYMLQIQQYQTQLQNIQQLAGLPAGLGTDAVKAYQSLNAYKNALTTLQGSVSQQRSVIDMRLTEARLSGMSWPTYLDSVQSDVNLHRGRAIERLQYEQTVLQQVQSDYDFARNLQSSIPTTVGVHQSVQMLNTQMNRVVTQNAKLLEVVSMTLNKAAEQDSQKALDKTQLTTNLEIMRQRQQAIEERQRAFGGLGQ